MNRSKAMLCRFALLLTVSACGLSLAGCGGQSEPTKIYEGGGTIPEIVDQPEPGEGKKDAAAKK